MGTPFLCWKLTCSEGYVKKNFNNTGINSASRPYPILSTIVSSNDARQIRRQTWVQMKTSIKKSMWKVSYARFLILEEKYNLGSKIGYESSSSDVVTVG